MTNSDRQQRMAERMLEDESLRGDLEDDAASALVDWASKRAAAAAADPARPDADVEAQVRVIRQAARAAALSGETEPRRLIALAEARIAPGVTLSADAAQPEPSAAIAQAPEAAARPVAPDVPLAQAEAAAPMQASQPPAAAPQARSAPPVGISEPGAAKAAAPRPRRRRNRLARFLKRLRGER